MTTESIKRVFRVCDSCLTEAYDLGAETLEEQTRIMITMGRDLPDHTCDRIEEPDLGIECKCAGHRR